MSRTFIDLKEGRYSSTFIIWLSMALYLKLVDNAEIKFWHSENLTVDEMTKELEKKVRSNRD